MLIRNLMHSADIKRTIIIISISVLGLGALVFAGFAVNRGIEKQILKSESQAANADTNNGYTSINEEKILDDMHSMANTLIIAEDGEIWGTKEMNRENVIDLQDRINNTNISGKDKLLEILQRWYNNDFRDIVKDHNYVWGRLNGTVGRAQSPNNDIKNGRYKYFE